MKTCPYCAEEIQDAAIVCKHCGRELQTGGVQPVQPAAKRRGRMLLMFLLLVGGLVALGAYLRPTSRAELQRAASLNCQQFVRERLRAPKTAEFPPPEEAIVQPISLGHFEVRSYVDAQNGFGALIRSVFECVVMPTDERGHDWRLISVKIGDEKKP